MTALIITGIVFIAALTFFWYYRTQTVWVKSDDYARNSSSKAKTLVVTYSRTGNTAGAAKSIARYFNADLLEIKSPQYSRDLKGLKLASEHASEEVTTAPIEHKPVELSDYDFIFLCTPTWWFRPAVPMFSFAENHDFGGKPVMLVMTGNSRKTDEKTKDFEELLKAQNADLLDVLFIKRGRIYWQKTPDEVNTEVLDAIKQRENIWAEFISPNTLHPSD